MLLWIQCAGLGRKNEASCAISGIVLLSHKGRLHSREVGQGTKVTPEVWLLTWYCVSLAKPACMKWDGATEKVALFKGEAECVVYAKKIAHKVHTSFHFDLEYICRKGIPPEPYQP